MVSPRAAAGNLEVSVDEATPQVQSQGHHTLNYSSAREVSKFASTPPGALPNVRNSSNKGFWSIQPNDDQQLMPEIAESVISREEDDFEENRHVELVGI